MGVDENTIAGTATEQVVDRRVECFAFDVPQCDVYGGDGCHGHGTATPVCSTIKILPDVLRLEGVASDQARQHVFFEVSGDGEFASIQRGVPKAIDALIRLDAGG